MSDPVIEVGDLTVSLPPGSDREYAVENASLHVLPGETFCIVGESGSGKSVLAQAIMGMLPPELTLASGAVRFEGRMLPAQRSPDFEILRSRRMAMIFQDAAASLDPIQRVGRQLEEILQVHGVKGRTVRRRRVMALLEAVHLADPARVFRAYPHQLSGGQCQRIVIAGALALDPVLLIADEPTTALDVTTQAEILRLIAELQVTHGTAVLFITHDIGITAEIADRVAVMSQGQIVETGTRGDVLNRPSHPYTRKLLAAVPHPADARQAVSTPLVLEAEGITRTYKVPTGLFSSKPLAAVRQVSLGLQAGKTLGIVGESGSGKSTLARCLLRLEEIDGGRILFQGQDVTHIGGSNLRALRSKFQVVLQDPYTALDPRQKVGDAVAEGPLIHGASRTDATARTMELFSLVGLPQESADRFPHEFSGGQRQRVCIARALALRPEVLIADEAVSSLDVSVQAQILDLFETLQQTMGFAMIFITHDLLVAAAICDDVIVMRNGEAVERGRADEVLRAPRDEYTKRLVAAVPGGIYHRSAAGSAAGEHP